MNKSHIKHHTSYILILLFLGAVLVSCRPKGILHSWEMRAIMVDLHKTDAVLQLSGLQYGHEEDKNIYYAMVLERHGVSQAEFDSSLVWYTAHPQLFDKIYPKVIAQLQEEQKTFELTHAEELHLKPSSNSIQREGLGTKKAEVQLPPLSQEQLDSMLWVIRHNYPSIWAPYPGN